MERPDSRGETLRGRWLELPLEPIDHFVDFAFPRLQAPVELELLQGLQLVAPREVDLGDLPDRHEVLAVVLQGVLVRPDGVLPPVEMLVGLPERHVGGDSGRVDGKAPFERDDRVAHLPLPAVLLREGEELPGRRIPLQDPLQLLETGRGGGCFSEQRHGSL